MNAGVRCVWGLATLTIVAAWPSTVAAQSESAGVNQYFNNCGSCHESSDPDHQAPKTSVLKQMTPEHIYQVLTSGSIRTSV